MKYILQSRFDFYRIQISEHTTSASQYFFSLQKNSHVMRLNAAIVLEDRQSEELMLVLQQERIKTAPTLFLFIPLVS